MVPKEMERELAPFCFVLFALLTTEGVTCHQRFIQQPVYTEVNPGQDALLICKVLDKRGTCSWQKDHKPVGIYNDKYEWASNNQQNGDCSLWIRSARLEFDDGIWECQVTSSDFQTQDALSSRPVKLVVRDTFYYKLFSPAALNNPYSVPLVSPQRPRIEYNDTQILPGHNLTTLHDQVAVIKCISHYGNPPATLKWFLENLELTPKKGQTNITELDSPKTWLALSILELTVSKKYNGKSLRCVAVHETYSTKSSITEVTLDVMFVPETKLVGVPTTDVEDLKDQVAIKCLVISNPKASVIWKKEGQFQTVSTQETLYFNPVLRESSGLYTCHARNLAGDSQPARVLLDVKYNPKVISIGSEAPRITSLFSSISLKCLGEGNPPPTYKWYQSRQSGEIAERSRESLLLIPNVTYEFQGKYFCEVMNIIKGQVRTDRSNFVELKVKGAPQVLKQAAIQEVFAEKGSLAELSMVVCADPHPSIVFWEWGSTKLEAGSKRGRYKADLMKEKSEDCFVAILQINDTSVMDSRAYFLTVANDKGRDRHIVQLHIMEPISNTTLISIAGILLSSFLAVVGICICIIRYKKCCIESNDELNPSDSEGQTSNSTRGIPADAIYTTNFPEEHKTPTVRSSEAMKRASTLTYSRRSSLEEGPKWRHTGLQPNKDQNKTGSNVPDYFDSDEDTFLHGRKYHSYNATQGFDNWSYSAAPIGSQRSSLPSYNKYIKKSLRRNKNIVRPRPKPLQMENEKYYDHVFRSYSSPNSNVYYKPKKLDHAEL